MEENKLNSSWVGNQEQTFEIDRTYIVEIIKLYHEIIAKLEIRMETEKKRTKEHTVSRIESKHQKNG